MAYQNEFPITAYDRPKLAAANLLKGDIGGMLQSITDPVGLSPDQMETIRARFLKGSEKNPLLKAVADMATNPLMLIGLVMSLHPVWGKVARSKDLAMFFKKGDHFIKDVNPFMKYITSMQTEFRALGPFGFYDKLREFTLAKGGYVEKHGDMVQDALEEFTRIVGRTPTKREQYMMALKLDGWDEPAEILSRSVKGGVSQIRYRGNPVQAFYSKFFNKDKPLLDGLEQKMNAENPALMNTVSKIKKMYESAKTDLKVGELDEVAAEHTQKGIEIGDTYFPHVTTRTPIEAMGSIDSTTTTRQYSKQLIALTKKGVSRHLKERRGGSLPYRHELEVVKDLFSPEVWDKLDHLETARIGDIKKDLMDMVIRKGAGLVPNDIKDFMKSADPDLLKRLEAAGSMANVEQRLHSELLKLAATGDPKYIDEALSGLATAVGAPARYSIELLPVTQHYINATAPTYAWVSRGLGAEMDAIVQKGAEGIIQAGRPAQRLGHLLEAWQTQTAPMLRGFKDPKEYARGIAFQDLSMRAMDVLSDPQNPYTKLIPKQAKEWLVRNLSGARGSISDKTIGGRIAGLFYASTLGLNLSPITNNMMQNIGTTMNFTGPAGLVRGLTEVANRMPKYMSTAKKVGFDKAMRQVFPEYYAEFGAEGIMDAIAMGDSSMEGQMAGRYVKGAVGKTLKVMGAPFGMSEKFNRLTSFYSFHNMGLKDGLAPEMAREMAGNMTRFTQFTGGVTGQPKILRGVFPPFRQFMHYPMRYLEMLYGAQRMGGDPTQRSLGVLGRGLVASTAVYELGKNLMGVDLSSGLMFGSLPKPGYEGGPFYPFPFVPPAVSLGGEALRSVATGNYDKLKEAAWLGVPSGLAIRRAIKTFSPKYADYKNRTMDGKIPLYNDKGMLINSLSPMQLIGKGLGVNLSAVKGEQGLMEYLLRHKEDMREYRRQYLEALSQNNLEKAQQINSDYMDKYKDVGPIVVKKSDIRAINTRKQVSRLNRTISGFPTEARGLFSQMVEQAGLSEMAQYINSNTSGTTLSDYIN